MQCSAILLALAGLLHLADLADAYLPVSRSLLHAGSVGGMGVVGGVGGVGVVGVVGGVGGVGGMDGVGGVALRMSSEEEDPSSSLLVLAKAFVASDFGVTLPSLLSKEFTCSGPTFKGITRESYLAGLAVALCCAVLCVVCCVLCAVCCVLCAVCYVLCVVCPRTYPPPPLPLPPTPSRRPGDGDQSLPSRRAGFRSEGVQLPSR
jgi:hypothetical protein